jgi:hypothetical protein
MRRESSLPARCLEGPDVAREPVDARDHQHVVLAEKVPHDEHAAMTVRNRLVCVAVHCVPRGHQQLEK